MFRPLLILSLTGISTLVAEDPIGQQEARLSWIEVPGSGSLVHAVQLSRDGRLILTPNEAFFPRLGLAASGEGSVPDMVEMNGGQSFAVIEKWDPGDAAEWVLWLTKPGPARVSVRMSGGTGRFTLQFCESSESVDLRSGAEATEVMTASFPIAQAGRHLLRLTCDEGGSGAAFHRIEVMAEGGVIRKRWRPAAAHTKFSSSRAPRRVRLWVMEMDAVPGELDFYSPITTPFGYYGPTWRADGSVNTGFNFSLWSFRRKQPEPPVEQLSHLLAIGNRKAKFGGFDHEGTGVKIRDWEPLAGRQGQRQALALRVEPGERYDTYFSYYYASDEKRWRLFGVGNQWNGGKAIESLWVGSFVEVPGPPQVQRTGVWERTMRYRGWVMDDSSQWFPLDRMERGNIDPETGLTHTDRGGTEDGWFFLQTGGWGFRKVRDTSPVELDAPAAMAEAGYLDEDDIALLTGIPSNIVIQKVERADTRARVTFEVRNVGKDAAAVIHWGNAEGLTLAERWPRQVTVTESLREGENQFIIEGVPENEPLFVRLLLTNDEGQFWAPETATASP